MRMFYKNRIKGGGKRKKQRKNRKERGRKQYATVISNRTTYAPNPSNQKGVNSHL